MNQYTALFSSLFFFHFLGCLNHQNHTHIRDNAAVLSNDFIVSLNQDISKKTSNTKLQFILYTINAINGIESHDDYTTGLVKETNFGKFGFKKSILLVIYPREKIFFLRWGDDIEKRINKADMDKVIDSIKPYFKKNDFESGVRYCVNQVYTLLEKDIFKEK